jgi:hypothetical protein
MKYLSIPENSKVFYAWQPSTWPDAPEAYCEDFANDLKIIFHDSILIEIENVIQDAPTLEHRGHVVALAILCAIDALSSYAYRDSGTDRCFECGRTDKVGPRYISYIKDFFPQPYRIFSDKIYRLYRNSITHSWNLFEAGMLPGGEPIQEVKGTIVFGLRHFFGALRESVENFTSKLRTDGRLQEAVLLRYKDLKGTARP